MKKLHHEAARETKTQMRQNWLNKTQNKLLLTGFSNLNTNAPKSSKSIRSNNQKVNFDRQFWGQTYTDFSLAGTLKDKPKEEPMYLMRKVKMPDNASGERLMVQCVPKRQLVRDLIKAHDEAKKE